jgi:hypothetical protein
MNPMVSTSKATSASTRVKPEEGLGAGGWGLEGEGDASCEVIIAEYYLHRGEQQIANGYDLKP